VKSKVNIFGIDISQLGLIYESKSVEKFNHRVSSRVFVASCLVAEIYPGFNWKLHQFTKSQDKAINKAWDNFKLLCCYIYNCVTDKYVKETMFELIDTFIADWFVRFFFRCLSPPHTVRTA
jgi:hypothetical protein